MSETCNCCHGADCPTHDSKYPDLEAINRDITEMQKNDFRSRATLRPSLSLNKSDLCVVDCAASLNQAVQRAGGTVFSLETMQEMSLFEFVKLAGPNGIRFTHDKSKALIV